MYELKIKPKFAIFSEIDFQSYKKVKNFIIKSFIFRIFNEKLFIITFFYLMEYEKQASYI